MAPVRVAGSGRNKSTSQGKIAKMQESTRKSGATGTGKLHDPHSLLPLYFYLHKSIQFFKSTQNSNKLRETLIQSWWQSELAVLYCAYLDVILLIFS